MLIGEFSCTAENSHIGIRVKSAGADAQSQIARNDGTRTVLEGVGQLVCDSCD